MTHRPTPLQRAKIFTTNRDGDGRHHVTIQCTTCGATDSRPLPKADLPPNIVAKWFRAKGWDSNKRLTKATCPTCQVGMQPAPAPVQQDLPVVPIQAAEAVGEAQATIRFITPLMAIELLEKNTNNRPVRWKHVQTLAEDIAEGRWRLNGETIKIARDGRILDGQHRLHAIVQADTAVRSYFVADLDHDVFDTIDQGRRRSPGDTLSVSGEKNATLVAAACGVLHKLLGGYSLTTRQGRTPVREVLDAHPGLRDSASQVRRGSSKVFASSAIAVVLHYLFGRIDPNSRDGFFMGVLKGLGLDDDDPVYHLRERLLARGAVQKKRDDGTLVVALCIRAWEARQAGQKLKKLMPGKTPAIDQVTAFLKRHQLHT